MVKMDKQLIKDSVIILFLLIAIAIILAIFSPPPNQGNTCIKQYCHDWSVNNFSSGTYAKKSCCHCVEFGDGIDQSTYERPLWMTINQQQK